MNSRGQFEEGRGGLRESAVEQTRQSFGPDLCSFQPSKLLTVAGLAAELQCSKSFLYRCTQKNAPDPIPVACWVGNRPRFKLADVETWLQSRKPNSTCDNLTAGGVAARDRRIRQMSRRCHQHGHVRLRKDAKRQYWQGLYRVRTDDGQISKWKSEVLGYKDEITKRQAQRRLQTIISKEESEIVRTPRPVITVKAFVKDHYVPEFVNNRKPGTRRGYLQIINAHVLPNFGPQEINQVTRRDVQLLINRMHAEGRSRHTCDNIRNVVRSMFRQAIRCEFLNGDNPATLIEMPAKDPRVPIVVPSTKQVCALLDAIEPQFQMLAWFVLATGCRIGEALGLKWGAVDFEENRVWFLTARYIGEEHLTKGHRSQEPVILTKDEATRLRKYKSRTPDVTEDDLVFPHPKDPKRAMIDDFALSALQRAGARVGLHVTWHQLRHWGASMLYRAGVPIKVIQKRLGHSKYQTTADWYVEHDDSGARKAAKIHSKLLHGWTKKHPANVAANVAVSGDKESSADVSC